MSLANILEQVLATDLEEFISRLTKRRKSSAKISSKNLVRSQRDNFIKYLVSVASHPLGLRASFRPFNCSQEEMLVYIVEMFNVNIDENRLKKMLLGDAHDRQNLNTIKRAKKRHSWRPELRIRLNPLTFFQKERLFLDNLSVRIYLFKDEEKRKKLTEFEQNQSRDVDRTILNSIFRTVKLDLSSRIRPANEMRSLISFVPISEARSNRISDIRSNYKMVQAGINNNNDAKVDGDVYLNIRRYYCQPDSNYILRFEFWLNSKIVESNCFDKYRRYLKRLVYDGSLSCTGGAKSIYRNENQEFYGYINYNLNKLPAYAIKSIQPILNLRNRKVNNCEIFLEPRNRRLLPDDEMDTQMKDLNIKPRISNEQFLINHIRLYANCSLYQSLELINQKGGERLIESHVVENVNIDNFFYMPAQTLINQHRLQSNLSRFEDRSLRRVAFLLAINCLESEFGDRETIPNLIMNVLVSLTKSEYLVAHEVIDVKTMQEIDPFHKDLSVVQISEVIVEIEINMLRRFAFKFLQPRLKKYFIPIGKSDDINRLVTLTGLIMFNRALSYHENAGKSRNKNTKLDREIANLRELISESLDSIISTHLKIRLEDSIKRVPNNRERMIQLNSRANRSNRAESDSWIKLLSDIRSLGRDLHLNWPSKDIDLLHGDKNEQQHDADVYGRTDKARDVERAKLENLIKLKINDFVD